MDCIVPQQSALWTGALPQGLPSFHQRNYFSNFYFPQKPSFGSPFYTGPAGLFFPHDDDVDYPTDMKGELASMGYHHGMPENMGDIKQCVVCGERASGFYFGALVCLPCKSFYIRCTKDGEPTFTCQCSGNCDIVKQGRIRCQYCRYQRCLMAGMCRKEKPETVQPAEGQVLCKVCGDIANGIHFGVNTCEGCKKFFRRGLVENQSYICKDKKDCGINPRNRNNCRYCRYQKCLAVGMSREAIKMGRPKKADGSEINNNMTSSPKVARRPLLEVDNQQNSTNPQLGEDNNNNSDSLKSSSVCNQIKQEVTGTSCDYEKKMAGVWPQGHQASPWQQAGSQAQGNTSTAPTTSQTSSSSSGSSTVTSSQFMEEEMDEILMMLQTDNQSGGPNKRMRCYSTSGLQQRACKSEMGMPAQWHVPEMGVNDQPMNMTTSNMVSRPPPPPYSGYNNGSSSFQQVSPAVMPGSPCHSPNRQMPSPGGYMSDTSVQSPGYVPNGSPVHSPSCQYSPQNSPMYQASPSPHSPYQSDASSHGSPYSEPIYNQHPYSPDNSYHVTDLSVNVNCGPGSMMTPGSPHPMSPAYPGQQASSPSRPIPHQEGTVPENWSGAGSPPFMCHSPSQHSTIPTQEGNYRRCSTRLENLQRINQHFMAPSPCELQLIPNTELEGSMTRSDIEEEIVHKTLASVSPAESYYYVLSDNHSCSTDSGCSSSNYDEFTSCRRMNKRKNLNEADFSDSQRSEGAFVGRYKRHLSEKYWLGSVDMEDAYPMTTEKQAILEHLNKNFQQMSERCTDSNKQMNHQDGSSWQQIQYRIVRNTSAGVKFASQIPGFNMFHPEDKTFLCKTVNFMSAALMAGYNLYNPAENNFRDFWAWNIAANNPFYPFKQRLLDLGRKIQATNMDTYEVSTMAALLFLASDFTDLAYPEAIEDARRKIISALKSYLLSKGSNVRSRMQELFSLIPELRHLGMWHHELMKQMKINVQMHELHQLFDVVNYRES